MTPGKIPLDDDLGVYCRVLLRYQNNPTQVNLALMVLAQRVILEKAKSHYKRKGRLQYVTDLINQCNSDRSTAEYYARRMSSGSAVARQFPIYVSAGLV